MIGMHSDRLQYREICLEDAPLIVKWRSDPEVYKFFTAPHKVTLEEHINWYKNNYLANSNRLDFMALDSNGIEVGVFGIRRENEDDNEVEVSYLLAPEYYKRGFATEGVKWCIDYCIEHWNSKTVKAEIHNENDSSIRLVNRLGFKLKTSDGNFFFFFKELGSVDVIAK